MTFLEIRFQICKELRKLDVVIFPEEDSDTQQDGHKKFFHALDNIYSFNFLDERVEIFCVLTDGWPSICVFC